MTIRDQIEAAKRPSVNGGLTLPSRRNIARIKAQALQAVADDPVEREIAFPDKTRGIPDGHRAIISAVRRPHRGAGDPLQFFLEIRDHAGRVVHKDDHMVFNPPVMVQTGVEDDGVTPVMTEDPQAAFREVVANLAREALAR